VAATPIPTLIPATLPPQPTATLWPVSLEVSFPSRRPSTNAARELYQQHCVNCHGTDGKSIVPGARNFSDADYLRGQTPVRIYQIISHGRRAMPGWSDRLSVNERWDLAFYVWGFATSRARLELGKTIYQENCTNCHGADGKGIVPGVPDFTNVEWIAGQSPQSLFRVVTEGKNTMPSWQRRLSPDERWAAIEYLRYFACEPPIVAVTASK
jgi:cbb3-type cytochrome c oxidase subunit III